MPGPTKYRILIKRAAKKALEKIPERIRGNIEEKILELADDPLGLAEGGPMRGFESRYKFRQGSYRVIYEVSEEEITVNVIKIGSRGDVYKD